MKMERYRWKKQGKFKDQKNSAIVSKTAWYGTQKEQ